MQLRPYQVRAVQAVWDYLAKRDGNPCVVLPTGAGKTPVCAQLCTDAVQNWGGRVLVLAHVRELLEQLAGGLRALCPSLPVGIYSAGLGERTTAAVTVAGIQSVWRRVPELFGEAPPDLCVCDECHLITPEGEGMYRTLFAALRLLNPSLRVIGLTATPYRLGTGMIVGGDQLLTDIVYEANVLDLIRAGWLSSLRSVESEHVVDTSALHQRAGEFVAAEVDALMQRDRLVEQAVAEIVRRTADRTSVLVFAAGVEHGKRVAAELRRFCSEGDWTGGKCGACNGTGESVGDLFPRPCQRCVGTGEEFKQAIGQVAEVYGDTDSDERRAAIAGFRARQVKYLVNVSVLTTGFDAPNVDCIALLRPTMSPGLYYQMLGRGLRKCDGKADCLVIDFAGCVNMHGPIDQLRSHNYRPASPGDAEPRYRTCPSCRAAGIPLGTRVCPECGAVLIEARDTRHEAKPQGGAALSTQIKARTLEVRGVDYAVHVKKDADEDAPRTMRVDYEVGFNQYVSEWVCVEHDGFARSKALVWWAKRSSIACPTNADDAVRIALEGMLAEPTSITVRPEGKFERIEKCELPAVDWSNPINDSECPF